MEWLETRTHDCLRFCQSILTRGDGNRPCILFGRRGAGENPLPMGITSPEAMAESTEKVKRAMRMLRPSPEYALFVSDSYVHVEGEPPLIENLIIVAESGLGTYTINQEYYRSATPGVKIFFGD